jgi:hypothetical protein
MDMRTLRAVVAGERHPDASLPEDRGHPPHVTDGRSLADCPDWARLCIAMAHCAR